MGGQDRGRDDVDARVSLCAVFGRRAGLARVDAFLAILATVYVGCVPRGGRGCGRGYFGGRARDPGCPTGGMLRACAAS